MQHDRSRILLVGSPPAFRQGVSAQLSTTPDDRFELQDVTSLSQAVQIVEHSSCTAVLLEHREALTATQAQIATLRKHMPVPLLIVLCEPDELTAARSLQPRGLDECILGKELTPALLELAISHAARICTMQQELKELTETAEQNEMIFSILSSLAHNLNNPLCGISGIVQLQSFSDKAPDSSRLPLSEMLEMTKKMADIVRYMFKLVSHSCETASEFAIDEAVGIAVERFRETAEARNVVITTELHGNGRLDGRKNEFQKAIGHLIVNSLDAMERGGTIRVTSTVADGRCTLVVSDTGKGMSAQVLPQALEPLFTTKHHGRHRGLGLSLVKCVVERFKGQISLASQPEAGTTVTLQLPILVY
jgi:signal transduction histidine kinase